MIRLICYAHSAYTSACNVIARAHDVRLHCRLKSPFYRESLRIPAQSLYCKKLESLKYMTAAMVLVYLYLLLRNSFRKPRKGVQNER